MPASNQRTSVIDYPLATLPSSIWPYDARRQDILDIYNSVHILATRGVLNHIIDITDSRWGADPTGVQDSTPAINAAIAYLIILGVGGAIFIPAGHFKLLSRINIAYTLLTFGIMIYGVGPASRLEPAYTNDDIFLIGDGANQINNIIFKDFLIWPTVVMTAGYAFNCRLCKVSQWQGVLIGSNNDYIAAGSVHHLWKGIYWDRFGSISMIGGSEIVTASHPVRMRGNADQSFGAEVVLDQVSITDSNEAAITLGGGAGGVYLGKINLSRCRKGIICDSSLQGGTTNRELFFGQFLAVDDCLGSGLHIYDNGLAILQANDAWFSGNGSAAHATEAAIVVDAGTGPIAEWGSVRIQASYYDGMNLGSGIHTLSGGFVQTSGYRGGGAPGPGNGITITNAALAGFDCDGVAIHNNGDATRGSGIDNSVAADYTVVDNNLFFSNGVGALLGVFTGGNRVMGVGNVGYTQVWIGYNPGVTAGAGAFTTVSAAGRYRKVDRMVFFYIEITITNNGTAAVSVDATLPPFTPAVNFTVAGRESTAGGTLGGWIPAGGNIVSITRYDNTYPGAAGFILTVSGLYEATT